MINLTLNLPERYDLVSIHKMWNGTWTVCVKIINPHSTIADFYGLGEHADLEEAAKIAIERAEYRYANPTDKQSPNPREATMRIKDIGLNLKDLGL